MKGILSTLLLCLSAYYGFAQTDFSTTDSGNWQDITWTVDANPGDADGIPDADDNVVIKNGASVTVNQDQACNNLDIEDDGSFTEFIIASGDRLTVNGIFDIDEQASAEIEITINGILDVDGTFDVRLNTTSVTDATLTFTNESTGTITMDGATALNKFWNDEGSTSVTFINHGAITVADRFRIRSTDGSAIRWEQRGSMSVGDELELEVGTNANSDIDFEMRGGSLDLNEDLIFDANSPAVASKNVIDMDFTGTPTINLAGNFTLPGEGTINAGAVNVSTFTYDGTGAQDVGSGSTIEYHDLVIAGSNTKSLTASISASEILDDLTINSGSTLNMSSFTLATTGDVTNNGTFTQSAALTVGGNYVNVAGTSTHTGTAAMNVTGNLTNNDAFTQTGLVTVGGDFSHTADSYSGSGGLTITGSFTNNSTFAESGTMNITTNYTNTGASAVHTCTGAVNVTGNFDNSTSANFNVNGGNLDIGGNFTNAATYTSSGSGSNINIAGNWNNTGGTYTYSGTDKVTMDGTTGTATMMGTSTFYDLTINHGGIGVTNSGTVTIINMLDIDDGTFTTGGTVTLQSDATATARLGDISGGDISGDITVQRYLNLTSNGWREITAPISSATLANWNDDNIAMTGFTGSNYPAWSFISVYTYDDNTTSGGDKNTGWVAATNTTNSISPSAGNRVYIGSGTYTLSVTGAPNKNTQAPTLEYNDGSGDADEEGWNLVGNPYPCTIDWENLVAGDRTNIENGLWIFAADAGSYGAYTGGDLDGEGTNGVGRYIGHSQSFWVHATAASPSLTWNEEDKYTNDRALVKTGEVTAIDKLKIHVSGDVNSYYDESILKIRANATDNKDLDIDAIKLYSPDSYLPKVPTMAFISKDDVELSINSVPPKDYDVIPLKVQIGENAHGTYTLDFSNTVNFAVGKCLMLEDLHTGNLVDLRSTNTYQYASDSSTVQPRFQLHIGNPLFAVTEAVSCYGESDGKLIVEHLGNLPFSAEWKDEMNQTVATLDSLTGNDTIQGVPAGTYSLYVSGTHCTTVESIVDINEPDEIAVSYTASNYAVDLTVDPVVSFTNSTSGAASYLWNFGDGNTSTEANPTHTYTTSGTFTVNLKAFSADGICSADNDQTIEVTDVQTGIEKLAPESISMRKIENRLELVPNFGRATKVNVSIFNATGQKVYQSEATLSQDVQNIELPELSSGVYNVRLEYNDQYTTLNFFN